MTETYKTLFSIRLLHSYFNDGSGRQALAMVPTQQTAHLLQRIGMSYQIQQDGLSVIFPVQKAADYINYLQMEQMTQVFCFQLVSKDASFYNYTQLDYPGRNHLLSYHSSRTITSEEGVHTLLLPDSGQGFAKYATALPTEGLTALQGPNQEDISWSGDSVSLAHYGEGAYSATQDGQNQAYCYFNKGVKPLPMGLCTVHLSDPHQSVFEEATGGNGATELRYDIRFDARKTIWRYVFSNASGERDISACRVEGNQMGFEQKQHQGAVAFESQQELLLQERYEKPFSLRNGQAGRAVIERLPGATADLILPEKHPDGQKIYSEIYVHI